MTVDNDQFNNDLYCVDPDFDVNSTTRGGGGGSSSSSSNNKNRKLKNPAGRNHHRNKKKITPTSTTTTNYNSNNNNSFNKNSSSYNNIINGNCSNRSSRSVRFSSDTSSIGGGGDSSINSGLSSNYRDCYIDDVSSLHFDEYGYDAKIIATNSRYGDDDDDDSVSQFFNAPTRRELSTELFKLVEPNGSTGDALSSLSKLRMWGLVADTDEVTTKYLLEYRAVPTLLYFVRDIIDKRRILSMKVKNINSASNNSNKQLQMQMYIDEANNNELCLHQAMQVIYHCTCFGDSGKNKKQNNNKATVSVVPNEATGIKGGNGSSSSSAKNVITQLVETDGIELLVTILEEQLRILAQANGSKNAFLSLLKGSKSPPKATKEQFNVSINNINSTIGQYSHSVSKSVWLILMNVGTCDTSIKLLKTTNQKKYSHQLKRLVIGIVIGLNHRFYVSGLGGGGGGVNQHHIMPITQNSSRDTDWNHGGGESSWMEDLFITLCRLVGSKHADSFDNNERKEKKGNTKKEITKQNNNSNSNTPNIIEADDHDEIRSMLIEKWIVKKCLKLLLDENNIVLGKDSFITTLAMSFFYACMQFSVRYKKLNNPKNCVIAKKNNENVENEGRYNGNSDSNNNININAEKTVSRSLDYDRLIHFTLKSMKSFPSHQLVQGTGCLILESIPKPYKLLWMNTNRGRTMMVSTTAKSSISTTRTTSDSTSSLSFTPHRKTIASAFVKEVLEPCSWYCVDT